jgi:hypothetical protein
MDKEEFLKRLREELEKPRTFLDDIYYYSYRLFHWFKRMYREVCYGFQRMFRGYDDVDTFEISTKFIERHRKILPKFKKGCIGHSGRVTDEEWDNILDEMIYHLKYMEDSNVIEKLKDGMPEEWEPDYITVYGIMKKHKDEFFKLYSEHFYDL